MATNVHVYIVTEYSAHWASWRMMGVYTSQQDAEARARRLYGDDQNQRYGVVVERMAVNTADASPMVVLHLNIERDDE